MSLTARSKYSSQLRISVGSNDNLAPNMWQAIILANGVLIDWCI